MDLQGMLEQIRVEVEPCIGVGSVADYIPSLATVDPNQFGMAVALDDGQVFSVGDADVPFSVQSISKVFSLALVIATTATRSGSALGASRRATRSTRCCSSTRSRASHGTRSSTRVRSS